jgi:hypothetical protein
MTEVGPRADIGRGGRDQNFAVRRPPYGNGMRIQNRQPLAAPLRRGIFHAPLGQVSGRQGADRGSDRTSQRMRRGSDQVVAARSKRQIVGTRDITQRKRGFLNAPWFAFLISVAQRAHVAEQTLPLARMALSELSAGRRCALVVRNLAGLRGWRGAKER